MCCCAAKEYELRGCIGSLSARPISEIYSFARKSAFEDTRFDPLDSAELPGLEIGVSLLVKYEEAAHAEDWEVGIHGVILKFAVGGRTLSATYLPEVAEEQGWTQSQAIDSLVRKAGHRDAITTAIRASMSVTRYQSSKAVLTHAQWKRL